MYNILNCLDIQEFYELALQDESHSVTDEDISIAQKYIMDQFDAKVGLVNITNFLFYWYIIKKIYIYQHLSI